MWNELDQSERQQKAVLSFRSDGLDKKIAIEQNLLK